MHDDEDWAGYRSPEAEARRAANRTRMRERRDELLQRFDVIHGHFVPEKFAGMFLRTDFVAFFRDPIQQAVSHYAFLRRFPHVDHPAIEDRHHRLRVAAQRAQRDVPHVARTIYKVGVRKLLEGD